VAHLEVDSEHRPGLVNGTRTLGLYVHFPWCLQKCPYCDFLSIARERAEIPREDYTAAVLRELRRRAPPLRERPLSTVFFGGGTPSLWGSAGIATILSELPRHFSFAETGLEVTVECNPSSFSLELAREFVAAGVNRVSIGVQSLDAERLRFLGRLHDAKGGLDAVSAALEGGVPRVSADLIFGVAGQSPEDAAREAEQVAALGVGHLSAYSLTIEPGTAFGSLHKRGRLPLLAEAAAAQSFVAVHDALEARGFEHYEISNYAKPGEQSRHNLGYWRGDDYLGLGVGAWGTISEPSTRSSTRYRNTPSAERYLGEQDWPEPTPGTAGSAHTYHSCERLTPQDRRMERLMLGLRVREGVDLEQLEAELGTAAVDAASVPNYRRRIAEGHLRLDGTRLKIPSSFWLFADSIIRDVA
jgi:putative oxygen-independent coproporphyrinogen III oxidase